MSENIRVRIAVVIPKDNEILLVRHSKKGRNYWLIPGGGVDYGETIQDCARREIKEETNLDIKLIKLLFISESVSVEHGRHLLNLTFLGQASNPMDEIKVLSDERVQEARFVPVDKLDKIELHPPIAPFIKRAFKEEFQENAIFLGNLWAYSF